MIDGQTIDLDCLSVFEIRSDRIGETYGSSFSPKHQWYYYPEMTRDEVS
jgi:hypothetical protein